MSLRTRLAIITVGIVAVALVAANLAISGYVGGDLRDRHNDQLRGLARVGALVYLVDPSAQPITELPGSFRLPLPPSGLGRGGGRVFNLLGAYTLLCGGDGEVVLSGYLFDQERRPPDVAGLCKASRASSPQFFDTETPGGTPYRALRITYPATGQTIVVALPATDLYATLDELFLIQVLASLGVLVTIAALVWWLAGLELRPLRRIESTAAAIAGGDLTQRIETPSSRTEIGRLGDSLNVMLTEIETAFAAKETSEAKLRQFVADASHELRTPLTAVRGYSELFLRVGTDGGVDHETIARRIQDHANRMSMLVEDLLLLSHLDEERPLARDPVDMTRLAAECVADAQTLDPALRIELEASEDALVVGDQARLAQVVGNLLANARSYAPSSSPIEIRVLPTRDVVRVEVVDHGPGIPHDLQGRIFDRFVRGDPSRNRQSGGAGLGLAIVAAITEAHRGRFGVVETIGGGSTFWIELPRDSMVVGIR